MTLEILFLVFIFFPYLLRILFYVQLNKLINMNNQQFTEINRKITFLPLIPIIGIYFLFKISKQVDKVIELILANTNKKYLKDNFQLTAVFITLFNLLLLVFSFNDNSINPEIGISILFALVLLTRVILGVLLYISILKVQKI